VSAVGEVNLLNLFALKRVMSEKNLVGRCGLYCGSCIIYRAERDSEELRKRIAERNSCKIEEVHCEGCQIVMDEGWDGDEVWGKNCDIVNCLESKGLKTCYDCSDVCEKFENWYEEMLEHGEDLKKNLKKINEDDLGNWLNEEKEKWSCPECGKPLIINLEECHHCGVNI